MKSMILIAALVATTMVGSSAFACATCGCSGTAKAAVKKAEDAAKTVTAKAACCAEKGAKGKCGKACSAKKECKACAAQTDGKPCKACVAKKAACKASAAKKGCCGAAKAAKEAVTEAPVKK